MSKVIRSTTFTLTFGYIAFGIVALVLFAAPLWYAWQVTMEDGRSEILHADAQRLTEVFHREGATGLKSFIDARVGMQLPGERILMLADASLQRVAGNLTRWPSTVPTPPGMYTVTLDLGGKPTQSVVVRAALPGGYNLLVGRDVARFAPLARHFWTGLAGAIAVLSIAGVLGGVLIRRAILARILSIRRTVLAIVQGDLSHRLPSRISGDELDTLSHTINGMLDQIEQLINGIRDVSNSIAHDLRTPLAELRSRLEELSLTRPTDEETFAEIDGAVADVDRVIRIFNALLRLAEIDTGMRRSGFVQVNANELAAEVVEFYSPAAEVKDVSLVFSSNGPVLVSGDPTLLAQAVGNLVDNALKYAGEQGAVKVEVQHRADGSVEICVADDGPGIPDAEKPKVAQRFYRGDASRGTPGVGLGLSLVQAVAKLHGGTLELNDNFPGLRARMIIEPGALLSGRPRIATVEPKSEVAAPVKSEPSAMAL
ncbi:MAG TPA: HAMP domain-containing sensor histidine kinase [Steroidobacteraceae bacterium]|nr:HAMP domain-containing sensor histidine kinase [Steroidobacteraceae bacterium]